MKLQFTCMLRHSIEMNIYSNSGIRLSDLTELIHHVQTSCLEGVTEMVGGDGYGLNHWRGSLAFGRQKASIEVIYKGGTEMIHLPLRQWKEAMNEARLASESVQDVEENIDVYRSYDDSTGRSYADMIDLIEAGDIFEAFRRSLQNAIDVIDEHRKKQAGRGEPK